ncbi:hypothetical protein CONCODRAFT_2547 [Conidiobolus coronatus NRRL 28638]|uniref:G-protein coupled receptors family 1 profile domain-containing protein n=1 Tax=Conidiobolus coronatus (strain ATCC 28846 / CBS 209.66 / NRRL 28638) TaxID=796925 RepID=A0A137PH82_CONC2|nr:hypothetical protein CONCODRAFT_2547 [Conidiobolus coronatus NRRL 28638]|eukprot:KXN74342.1 hypothetical protein CONCODRAFT_2547 [Conidiobolus coronatus NRRL 28638]
MNLTTQLNVIIHPIGMACSILVIASIVTILCINKKISNRMTIRLVAAIAIGDLMIHAGEYYSATHGDVERASPLCIRVNAFRLFSRNFYCFTNLTICFHLYRSYVKLKQPNWKYEIFTWTIMLALTIIFTLIYYFMGAFTGLKHPTGCKPGAESHTMDAIFTLIKALLEVFTIVTCVTTSIIGHRSLNNWIEAYASARENESEDREQFVKEGKKMAERSFLYPLSTTLTLPFEAIFLILIVCGKFVPQLTIPMAISSGITGVLTFIAFSIDPYIHSAFKEAYHNIRGTNKPKSQQSYNIDEDFKAFP